MRGGTSSARFLVLPEPKVPRACGRRNAALACRAAIVGCGKALGDPCARSVKREFGDVAVVGLSLKCELAWQSPWHWSVPVSSLPPSAREHFVLSSSFSVPLSPGRVCRIWVSQKEK